MKSWPLHGLAAHSAGVMRANNGRVNSMPSMLSGEASLPKLTRVLRSLTTLALNNTVAYATLRLRTRDANAFSAEVLSNRT